VVRHICEQTTKDEVFCRGIDWGPNDDQHKLRNEDADCLGLVDGDGTADKAGDPDGGCPQHHKAELLPSISEKGLVNMKDT
jgi:hypothetical protein